MSDACGFCGHADAPEKVYAPLRSCIEELICRQGVREFYVGSEGAFDRMALRALRPLNGLSPCWLFSRVPGMNRAEPVWVPLADRARLATLLSRGWSAVGSETTAGATTLALCPV